MSEHDWLTEIDDEALFEEVARREEARRLGDAVTTFCSRVGLPDEVAKHVQSQFELINPSDYLQAAHHLGAAAYLFAESADEGNQFILPTITSEEHGTPTLAQDSVKPREGTEPILAMDPNGRAWASSILKRSVGEDESLEELAREIYITTGSIQTRQRPGRKPIDPQARIHKKILGMSMSEIAEAEDSTPTAVQQWFSKLKQRIEESEVTPSDTTEVAEPAARQEQVIPEGEDFSDEPEHVKLAEVLCRDLLPHANKSALCGLLDPKNNGDMTQSKLEIIDSLVTRVEQTASGVRLLDELDIADGAKASVRAFLGIGYRKNGTDDFSRRPPLDHRSQLKRIVNPSERRAKEALFYEGIESLVERLLADDVDSQGTPRLVHRAGKLQVSL